MNSSAKCVEQICKEYNMPLLINESMKKHTSFCIGGKCRGFISISSEEGLLSLLDLFSEDKIEYAVLGRGSNVLVSDSGYDGYILNIGRDFSDISMKSENCFTAQAGATLRSVGKFALDNSLTGVECLYGIPGSVGGAVYMNAGAYGGEVADSVCSVRSVSRDGKIKQYHKEELDFSYRHSVFVENQEIVLSAEFSLSEGNREQIEERMKELDFKRKSKQPLEFPSAGSTFKRPEGSYASLLIDECGLKGLRIGDAEVSTKHSGFIINRGNATCKDVIELCRIVKETVKKEKGFDLELEPVLLGDF